MQLPIQFENLLASLCNFEKYKLFILALLRVDHGGASDIVGVAELSNQARGHHEALPIEHNNCLPIIEFEE